MFDRAGAVGPPHWRSRLARNFAERWLAELIEAIRAKLIDLPKETAAHRLRGIEILMASFGSRASPPSSS